MISYKTQLSWGPSINGGEHTVTTWKAKSFLARIKFLFTGKLYVIEKGFTSSMAITVKDIDPDNIR
jgi:hypothetical protein